MNANLNNPVSRNLDDWLAWQQHIHPTSIDMSLDRIRSVANRLDLLLSSVAATVITVGGTNGKGSAIAFFESILIQAGYQVGSYTSPHILHYNERVRIRGVDVSDEVLCTAFERVEQARGDISLTYFEFGTLAALLILQQAKLDVVLLEVGLGGRLDAVNIIEPHLAVVTTIDLDHMEWLGPNREAIGHEKAGIFRANIPAVCGDPAPPQSLLNYANDIGASLYCQGKDFHFKCDQSDWAWRAASTQRNGLPTPHLRGRFQYLNASTVLMGLELLKDHLPVTQDDVRRGLINVRLPGRFQVLGTQPLVIVDVAHNAQGARSLADTLSSQPCLGKTYAVFSLLQDKDIASVLAPLAPVVDEWHVAGLAFPRGATMLQMLQRIEQTGLALGFVAGHYDVITAFQHVLRQAASGDRIVIFGSFFVVAEILKARIMDK